MTAASPEAAPELTTLSGITVLITGGAGFIGSEVVRQAVAAGSRVIVVDNLVNGRRENLEELVSDRCQLEVVDIRDGDRMALLLRGVDAVFHLACLGVRHSIHSPAENHHVNATATLELLAASRVEKVSRFVYVSSSEVYGTAMVVPQTEEHPTFPHTVYGAAKLAGECYTRAYHQTYGFPTVVVRPFNTYGPRSHHEGDCGEVIPKFMLRCLAEQPLIVFGDGKQTRDFTYVSDTARGILQAGTAEAAVGATLNLGQEREVEIVELARLVAQVVGLRSPPIVHDLPRPGDVLRLYASAARARELLGFRPRVSLQEGLSHLLAYYRGLGISPVELLKTDHARNWEIAP